MATLSSGSFSLQVIPKAHDADTFYLGVGLFCQNKPILTPYLTYAVDDLPIGFVEVEERTVEHSELVALLRPVITELWPAFWENGSGELDLRIVAYPYSFYYVVRPSPNITWADVLPELGVAAQVYNRYVTDRRQGDPPFDPRTLDLDDDGGSLIIEVFVTARMFGLPQGGELGIRLHVTTQVFAQFLVEVEAERQAYLAKWRVVE